MNIFTWTIRHGQVGRNILGVALQVITAPRIPSGGQRKDFLCTFIQHCSQPTGFHSKAARKSGCNTLCPML